MATATIRMDSEFMPASVRRIRILTVDEHPLVQEGLAAVINRKDDMAVVAMAFSGDEAIESIQRHYPDIVTLDLLLPDMRAEDSAEAILTEFPRTRLVAIASAGDHIPVQRALDAGIHGHVSKAASKFELVQAIRQVQGGSRAIPGPVASQLDENLIEETLTPRGVQVLQLVAKGNRNKQVAAQLSMADEMVRMHMKRIVGKLAVNERTHAVMTALTCGSAQRWNGSPATDPEECRRGSPEAGMWSCADRWTPGGGYVPRAERGEGCRFSNT